MLMILWNAIVLTLALTGVAMAQTRIVISSDWGNVTAELVDNEATRALVAMLPVTIAMRDHLRQEKTGDLPAPLPEAARQTPFAKGTLGLWSADHFVIYYRDGRVPQPGIVILGQVADDVSIFDRPGSVTVRVERAR
jgi:hypothetical protein